MRRPFQVLPVLLPCLACTSIAFAAAAPAPAPPALHLFGGDALVSVDANGAITAIEAPAEFGEAVAKAMEANIRKLHFQAPTLGDKTVPGQTWVQIQACTAPAGDNWALALKFRGNGPSLAKASSATLRYPREAQRANVGAKYDISMRVAPDGSASLEKATLLSGGLGHGKQFEEALGDWIAAMHYRTESVDGKPVGAQLTQRVEFVPGETFSGASISQVRRRAAEASAEARQANALASDTCALALKAGDTDENRQVAINSPIKVSEAN
jgi:hypothetical protein